MQVNDRVEAFRVRVQNEGEFALQLYIYATLRLLIHKYLYYECGTESVKDKTYDVEEQSWYVMHLAYGGAKDEISPCIGFDYKHPLAEAAQIVAQRWL